MWRCLPNDFPPWKTVYYHFRTWSHQGIWEVVNCALVAIARVCAGKNESPSLVCVDSQSQSAEPGVDARGLDGNKKINGRKRHIAVDTLGLLLVCICTAANVSDSVVGRELADRLNKTDHFPRLEKILGDSAYGGVAIDLRIGITKEASLRALGQKGFVPEAFRWAVERTFAWLNRPRRLVRNYEKRLQHQQSMNYIANVRLCIRRFEKWLRS